VSPLGLLGVDARVVWGVVAILVGIVLGRALRWFPYAMTIVVLIVLASFFLPAAALGGSAFIAVIVAPAAQRFLMDVMAGILIAFERWYAVGDFVMIEPSKAAVTARCPRLGVNSERGGYC
jgi:hypothetical protein